MATREYHKKYEMARNRDTCMAADRKDARPRTRPDTTCMAMFYVTVAKEIRDIGG